MDNKLDPVEHFVRLGLAQRFQQVFGFPLHYSTSVDKKATLAKMLGNATPKYPMAFLTFNSMTIDETRYSAWYLASRGLMSQASHDNMLAYRLRLLPTVSAYGITFYSQDSREVERFTKAWLFSVMDGGLKFTITYAVGDLDIHVDLDREIALPQRVGGLTEVDEYEATANLRVWGFHSKALETMQAVTSVQVEGVAVTEDHYKALNQVGRDKVQIFMFKNEWNQSAGIAGSTGDTKDVGA